VTVCLIDLDSWFMQAATVNATALWAAA
jgi:hypothetical protein